MKVIVGLGNPGQKYLLTRHNLGFMLIDALSTKSSFQKKHQSLIQKILFESQSILLVKPQTFMNLSGQAVQQIVNFYKISLEDLIVVHDDKDLSFGTIKLQKNRGHGGHKGIKDIHQTLQSQNYCRLKMGVLDSSLQKQKTADFVLADFTKEEQKQIPDILKKALQAIHCWIKEGFEKSSSLFNSK